MKNDDIKLASSVRPQSVQLENRETISVTGIQTVESFNEKEVQVLSDNGEIVIFGSHLHITKLDLDIGHLCVSGSINGFEYLQQRKAGLLGKLLG